MNRRQLIVSAPSAALSIGPACANETPAMAAFHEWKRHSDDCDRAFRGDVSDAESDRLIRQLQALLKRLVMEPARDYRDHCAKVVAFTFEGQEWGDDDGRLSKVILREACQLLGPQYCRYARE